MSVSSSAFAAGHNAAEARAENYYAKQEVPRQAREVSAQIDGDVRTGTRAHEVSGAHMLSLQAALKEGFDNVIGLESAAQKYLQMSLSSLPVKEVGAAEEYANDQVGKEFLTLLSNTRAQLCHSASLCTTVDFAERCCLSSRVHQV